MATGPPSAFEGVAIVRWRLVFYVLAAAVLAVGVGMFVLTNIVFMFLGAVAILMDLSRARSMRREVPASIGVRDNHLLVGGDSIGPVSAVSSAFVVPGQGETRTLRLLRRRRPALELRVRDQEHAVALMRALGLGPTQWAATYHLPSQPGDYWKTWLTMVAAILATGLACWLLRSGAKVAMLVGNLLAISLVAAPLSTIVSAPRLLIGTDGISLAWMRRTRFVPYREIVGVDAEVRPGGTLTGPQWWITIALTTGATLRFTVRPETGRDEDAYARSGLAPQLIAERIREAMVAATADVDAPAALLRCSGTPAARILALRALGREGRHELPVLSPW